MIKFLTDTRRKLSVIHKFQQKAQESDRLLELKNSIVPRFETKLELLIDSKTMRDELLQKTFASSFSGTYSHSFYRGVLKRA